MKQRRGSRMVRKAIAAAATAVLLVGFGAQIGEAQQGTRAKEYASCKAMHRDWPHGVAKSKRAADREVRDGYGRPHVSRRLYRANRSLDANDDGVACEA
jgi:hypothetical protein